MHSFTPYTIRHVQLTGAILPPTENTYLVFWWQKVPLGHLWVDNTKQRITFRKDIVNAVAPALDVYLSESTKKESWREAFVNGDVETLRQLLQANPLLQTFSKPDIDAAAISVVICTRNRTQALEQCIKALLQSSNKNFEVVVVDNAPDDDSTAHLLKNYPSVVYVRENRKGLSHARNTGVQRATHELIAFTDDDVLVDSDWIGRLKRCFTDPNTMCVTGLVIPMELRTKAAYIFEKYWGFNRGYVPLVFDRLFFEKNKNKGVPVWDIGAGANMAFRKSIFETIGYFDERLGAGASGCSEDSEYWYRILAEGYSCRYFPEAFVYHQHRDSEKELNKQLYSYMRGHVSALYIQYEQYGHKGNLHYLYHVLLKYYKDRLKHRLLKGPTPDFESFFTELKGCVSGWRFYKAHKKTALKRHRVNDM